MSDVELNPCPFCQGQHKFEATLDPHYGMCETISCGGKVLMAVYSPSEKAKAIALWNSRPLEDALLKRAEAAEARAERYEQALHEIDTWAKAYPLDVFPEPDFKQVREVLAAAGITIDQVSASNMRHVITGVARITENALKGGEE